ncbi:MAG: sulfite exporter TauE/SafE family protein [Actinomycetes bacterium]
MSIPKQRAVILMGFGIGAGLLSGMFGLGGGIIIVPGLMFALGMDQRRAHGTSLAGVFLISLSSFFSYWTHDHIDWPVVLWLSIGSVAGSLVGAELLNRLSKRTLTIAFIGILVIAGVRMFFKIDSSGEMILNAPTAAWLVVIGLVVGALAGMLGIGGGLMSVPILVIFFHVSPAVAKGTSLAVVIPTAFSGTLQNLRNKNSDLTAAAIVSSTGIVAAIGGSWIAARMNDAVSNFLFAVLLIFIAGRMLLQLRGEQEITPIGE